MRLFIMVRQILYFANSYLGFALLLYGKLNAILVIDTY